MSIAPLRVTQVAFVADVNRRAPRELLRLWPTLHATARAMADAGAAMTVIQPAHKSESFDMDGVHYEFVSVPGVRWLRGGDIDRVCKAVAATAPMIVHLQGLNTPRAVWPLRRALRGVPIVAQDRGTRPPVGLRRLAHRALNTGLSSVIFTARDQAVPWQRSWALPRSVPVQEAIPVSSRFTDGSREEARQLTDMRGDPCLLWIARLDANKDPFMILDAVEGVMARLPGLRLYCCFTESPLLRQVEARLAASPALAACVELLGVRPHKELELRYRAADFLVQGSHHEGSGYALIEALSCGATPLVTDIAPFRRIVGGAGSLTPVGDSAALAQAILDWSSRDRTQLRMAARAHFERELSFEVVGQQLVGALRAATQRTGVQPMLSNSPGRVVAQ